MKTIKITQIVTIETMKNVWIAKTTFFSPAKTEVEVKCDSEENAYQKLKLLLGIRNLEPGSIDILDNGSKIYNF